MSVTAKLVRVFKVDTQIRGLQTRLKAAEKFLADQDKDVQTLETKKASLESQHRQQALAIADKEGEVKRLDAKMETIREQMNNAQTNKEYKAFLTEVNTFKAERDKHEAAALELMTKNDELKKQLDDISKQREDRSKIREVASGDRDERYREIEGRLNELKAQYAEAVKDVPSELLPGFKRLMDQRGELAMGVVEVQDRRRHEYNCGACMMSIPVDKVSKLLSSGEMTTCVSCQCVLYLDEETTKLLQPAPAKK
jgi:uncharacterized protein